ncbi:HupE/UreJ family protein [Emcibacter sp. SYSU 3D8]|uniref:HupE/UreJ family protein n=1 Tax=Emcibacter sp. SYSU 3D8 TaxID=3133969 RepID=UPI0031FE87DD
MRPVSAHDSRPVVVAIKEQGDAVYTVMVTTPPSVPSFNIPTVAMPAGCVRMGEDGVARPALTARDLYNCPDGLGGDITLLWPKFNPSLSTMVRVDWRSGESRSLVAPPDETRVSVPDQENAVAVSGQYFRLGIEHILLGYDHLLFLACLLLIARTGRRIVVVVTGFTLAHSVTLALAALGLVRVPVPPVEAAIALSIIFLAAEIARPLRDTITWRHPIAVSCTFGLLHGFGFAAVLAEIGLPQTEVPLALLFFNVGVEAGQLMFIGALILVMLAALWILGKSDIAPETLLPRMEKPVAYGVGALAAFWMIERLWAFVPVS